MTTATRPTAAVIGSGVSGLTAAYLLQRRYDVSLYEAEPRLGGHAHTHDVASPDGRSLAVDTGFIVHNTQTYPHLLRLFAALGVETQDTEMSMSICCEGCGLEYAGARGVSGLFAQRRSLLRPAYLRMLAEVKRFHRLARTVVAEDDDSQSLGEFLRAGRFSDYFVRHFMVPVVACVWSTPAQTALDYPARYLFAFLDNHGMLSVTGSPQWRTVVGGSRTYVERAAKELSSVRPGVPVTSIQRTGGRIEVRDADDTVVSYDAAVVATHPDTALSLLADPTHAETAGLGAFRYSPNTAVLHTDDSLLPVASAARASWNYRMTGCAVGGDDVLVTYDMNRLQRLGGDTTYLVSLNPADRIKPGATIETMHYSHPVYTRESVAAQVGLAALNDGVTAFAGAYHGWGFHEDGCRSGVAAAASLGVDWDGS